MNKVLVIGASGMLGSAMVHWLKSCGYDVTALGREQYDLLQLASRHQELPLSGYQWVINCAGLINRHMGHAKVEDFWLLNSVFPRLLADNCERQGIKCIHISTDCVFDGKQGLYTEHSPATANDIYGSSKYLGEPANAMVLRTSIIGPEQKNFYSLLCWFLSTRTECQGYTNHFWNGVTTLELARIISCIIENNLWQTGIRHVYSTDVSKYDLLTKMAAAFSKKITIMPVEHETCYDKRLRTVYPDFLATLSVATLDQQLQVLASWSDEKGHCPAQGV